MGVKVATTGLHWTQPIVPHSPSSSQTLASAISSPSSKRRCRNDGGALVCRFANNIDRSALFGPQSSKLRRSQSCEHPKPKNRQTMKRSCSASLDSFSDEEFNNKMQELALRFHVSDDGVSNSSNNAVNSESNSESISHSKDNHEVTFVDRQWRESSSSDWCSIGEIIPETIERKANSVDLPVSLRMIKRKLKWQQGFREAGESAYCSVKKAFSSMVFIIRELHSFTLQMRELLYYEDLQGILVRVQKEMHASFVWLFQQVFSHTPTLMVYVMILLANFTVFSMGSNSAFAAASPPSGHPSAIVETVSVHENQDERNQKFDSSSIKSFSVLSSNGKTTSIGGNNGGGGKTPPVASGTDGDGGFDRIDHFGTVLPDGAPSQLSSVGTNREAESVSEQEETSLWNSILEEASSMETSTRDASLDHETIRRFVSPVTARIETDEYADYLKTELVYETALSKDPENPLILANYAQFLYLVANDYDRAEEYFKKATAVEPPDAEAYSKYASFLWRVRNDLWAAEETFLQAIDAEPSNSYYAANYAHFLWNTGGEDTCFPLSPPDSTQEA